MNVPQPQQPVDGAPQWVKVEISRAPNQVVSDVDTPSTYSVIDTVTGDLEGIGPQRWFYRYEDTGAAGTFDDWYKYRFADVTGLLFSNYSEDTQVNEIRAIQWALGDITDADLTKDDIVGWAERALSGLWPDIYVPIHDMPIVQWDADDDDYVDERYELPGEIHEVVSVERVRQASTVAISGATNATPIVLTTSAAHGLAVGDRVYVADVGGNTGANGSWVVETVGSTTSATLRGSVGNAAYTSGGTVRKAGRRHVCWLYPVTEWRQEGREIRFLGDGIDDGSDYVLHGKGRHRDITEVGEHLHELILWQIKEYYLDFRLHERIDTPRFTVLDRRKNVRQEDLERAYGRAVGKVAELKARLATHDFDSYELSPVGTY